MKWRITQIKCSIERKHFHLFPVALFPKSSLIWSLASSKMASFRLQSNLIPIRFLFKSDSFGLTVHTDFAFEFETTPQMWFQSAFAKIGFHVIYDSSEYNRILAVGLNNCNMSPIYLGQTARHCSVSIGSP